MPPSPADTSTGTATILFTDLVGSTTLRAALGEERAEAHRQAHHGLLAELAPVYAKFTEGFGRPLLVEAKTLLAELS